MRYVVVVAYFKVLCQHFLGGSEGNNQKPQTGPRCEPETLW